ncbi:MAG: hypothetical protein V2I36_00225 [Desulfopila sp.]|jgi:hypothetical protein|nr:hypothetical protein [Desulfopila sp.]
MTELQISLQQFGKIIVYDENSASHTLSALWQQHNAALFFVRHFG